MACLPSWPTQHSSSFGVIPAPFGSGDAPMLPSVVLGLQAQGRRAP